MMNCRKAMSITTRLKLIPRKLAGVSGTRNNALCAVRGFSTSPLLAEQDEDDQITQTWTKDAGELKRIFQHHEAMTRRAEDDDNGIQSTSSTSEVSDSLPDGETEQTDTRISPTELTYTGDATIPITTELHIVTPGEDTPSGVWPIFRVMVSV